LIVEGIGELVHQVLSFGYTDTAVR